MTFDRDISDRFVADSAGGGGNAPSRLSGETRVISSTGAVLQSVAVKLLIIGVNIVTGIITARALRPEGRGELAAMILWPVFLASVLSLGVPSALTFQLRRNPEKQSQLMGAALLLAILAGALAALLGSLFMRAWIPQYPPRVILFARLSLLSAPIGALLAVGRAGLESRGDFTASNKILIWSPAFTLFCLVALLAAHTMTPFSASLAYVPVGIAPLAWMASAFGGPSVHPCNLSGNPPCSCFPTAFDLMESTFAAPCRFM